MPETDTLSKVEMSFTDHIHNMRNFKALEKLPTLYSRAETYYDVRLDALRIAVIARYFNLVSKNEENRQIDTIYTYIEVTHRRLDKPKDTIRELSVRLKGLREQISKEAYPLEREWVLKIRETKKKGTIASRWVISL